MSYICKRLSKLSDWHKAVLLYSGLIAVVVTVLIIGYLTGFYK